MSRRRRRHRPTIRPSRISREVLRNTEQVGPVIASRAIAHAGRELLMNLYGIDATIHPFGEGKFQLRVYLTLGIIERRYADFYLATLNDLFTGPKRRTA